jgi:hypothetical protein
MLIVALQLESSDIQDSHKIMSKTQILAHLRPLFDGILGLSLLVIDFTFIYGNRDVLGVWESFNINEKISNIITMHSLQDYRTLEICIFHKQRLLPNMLLHHLYILPTILKIPHILKIINNTYLSIIDGCEDDWVYEPTHELICILKIIFQQNNKEFLITEEAICEFISICYNIPIVACYAREIISPLKDDFMYNSKVGEFLANIARKCEDDFKNPYCKYKYKYCDITDGEHKCQCDESNTRWTLAQKCGLDIKHGALKSEFSRIWSEQAMEKYDSILQLRMIKFATPDKTLKSRMHITRTPHPNKNRTNSNNWRVR